MYNGSVSKEKELFFHLAYQEMGEGPAVILIHGMYASNYDWSSLAPALAMAGYRALAPDLFGHGDSPRPPNSALYTCDTMYHTLLGWIQSLNLSTPFVLVGHSLGGYLSLKLALEHPEMVNGLALIDPLYSRNQLALLPALSQRRVELAIRAMQWATPQMIQFFMGWDPVSARFSPQTRLRIAMDYKRASPYVLYILRCLQDLTDELHQLKTPSLVVWGDRDLTLRPDSYPFLLHCLPNSEGYRIHRAGHQPHVGQPDQVNPAILEFVRRQLGSLKEPGGAKLRPVERVGADQPLLARSPGRLNAENECDRW